jgi:N-acylneuraminate cytidylyltransferase
VSKIAFIFARSGSKGLPGKNTRILGGIPLIAYSIIQAKEVKRIDRVIVSTDSKEIARIAVEFGADVPFMRPVDLSTDDSPEWLAWRHGINFLHEEMGTLPEAFISIPTTSPLRLPEDIENCIDLFEKKLADVVITVTEARRNPYFNMVELNEVGDANLVNSTKSLVAGRQKAPIMFDMTTVCYVAKPDFIMSHNSIFEGQVQAVLIPPERSIDIDSHLDFEIAEFLLSKRNK